MDLCLRREVLAMSTTVYVSVYNIGGRIFHPMGRVGGMTTISSTLYYEGKNRPRFGASNGGRPMKLNPSLTSVLRRYTGTKDESTKTTPLSRRSKALP